ncbi:hypothetical protein EVAR_75444_1 [Eumeta japonica]|uniref:Uncharacterized protein n=1 Tax=Eumeta variegata TaxID=151549 RepID=A0A4C1TMJ7_EUMVA|nr:hypothetical protein EVAR_75444_1 [Eumeta japonica]
MKIAEFRFNYEPLSFRKKHLNASLENIHEIYFDMIQNPPTVAPRSANSRSDLVIASKIELIEDEKHRVVELRWRPSCTALHEFHAQRVLGSEASYRAAVYVRRIYTYTMAASRFTCRCCARGRPIIVEWERDARHSAGLSRSVTHRYVTERYTFS